MTVELDISAMSISRPEGLIRATTPKSRLRPKPWFVLIKNNAFLKFVNRVPSSPLPPGSHLQPSMTWDHSPPKFNSFETKPESSFIYYLRLLVIGRLSTH